MSCPTPEFDSAGTDAATGCDYEDWRILYCDRAEDGGMDDSGAALAQIVGGPQFAGKKIRCVVRLSNRFRIYFCDS